MLMSTAGLIIEDDRSNHACVRAVLEQAGVAVTSAYTGLEGRNALAGSKFDVVAIRTDLPNLNGVLITKELKRFGPNTEAVVIGLADDVEAVLPACRLAGMNRVVLRPTLRHDLVASLRITGVISPPSPWPRARSVAVFDAFANDLRITLFAMLSRDGPTSATVLARRIGTTRQMLDFHLKNLVKAGVVQRRQAAREVLFEARTEGLMGAAQWMTAFADQPEAPPP
jgi:ArsR family transcriptional regulator, arsenate/arsenite/antimonite-responsive transcriptional repressor